MYVLSALSQPDVLAIKKFIHENTYYNPPQSCFFETSGDIHKKDIKI